MPMNTRKLLHSLGALADLGAEISSTHDFEEVVQASLHTLLGTLAIRKGAISRYSSSPGQLKIIAARGLRDAVGSRVSLGKDEVDRLIKRPGPVDLAAERNGLAQFVQRNGESLKRLRAAAIVPMVARGELMGVIFLSEKFSGEDYDSEDLAIIATISRHIGVAIYNHRLLVSIRRRAEENRRLYRELRDTYQNTIRAFAAAIDLKDAYTKGHSDRVARYSEAIAREMGVEGQELEHISVAGYLHDIGKIVVDRAIINNPRPLTDREFKELNTHVVTGYEILSSINRPWNEIAYMTKCHHERVDGKGYPQGLRGDEIPLGARIVTVADSFDAMMTDRPYRSRLSLEAALEELKRNSGRQFDAGVVSAFCRLVMKEIAGDVPRVLTATSGRGYDKKLVVTTLNSMINAPGATSVGH